MLKIKMLTDSASDIPENLEKELGIKIIGFPIEVDGKGYIERDTLTNEEFYELLTNCTTLPTTAQITQFRFFDAYKEIFDEGYTCIIHVSISSTGSNTYNNALMAKEQFFNENPELKDKCEIHVVDSLSYTGAYGYAVVESAKKVQRGATPQEILAYLDDWLKYVEIYFAPYTLEQVKRSGRVSAAAAFMGELLGFRPLIQMVNGGSNVIEKIRGNKNIIPTIADTAQKNMIPKTPYVVIKGSVDTHAEDLTKEMTKRVGYPPEYVTQIGAAVANNAGAEVAGIVIKSRTDA